MGFEHFYARPRYAPYPQQPQIDPYNYPSTSNNFNSEYANVNRPSFSNLRNRNDEYAESESS